MSKEYTKNYRDKATIEDVVNIVNATLYNHIQRRHTPWYRRAIARMRAPKRETPKRESAASP
jgi:hypothetical protein